MKITEKYAAKKEAILEKGMEVMWINGYNGTSVKDIVNAASIPKGSFYFYFESKEDFAIEALNYYLEFNEKLSESLMEDPGLSPYQKLRKLFKVRVDAAFNLFECECGDFQGGCFMSNLAQEMSDTNERIRTAVNEAIEEFKKPIIALLQAAQAAGEINAQLDAEKFMNFLESTMQGAFMTVKASRDPQALEDAEHFLFDVILKK